MTNRSIEDIALEIRSLGSVLSILELLVEPNGHVIKGGSCPTEQTILQSFYSVETSLDRIAEELEDMNTVTNKA